MKAPLELLGQRVFLVLATVLGEAAIAQPPIDVCDVFGHINPEVSVERRTGHGPSALGTGERAQRRRRAFDLDWSRSLPVATRSELSAELADVMTRFGQLLEVHRPTMKNAGDKFPRLLNKADKIWVPDGDVYSWSIRSDQDHGEFWSAWHGRVIVCIGMVLIEADLERVKAAERDYKAFIRFLDDEYHDVYPIEDSYWIGMTRGRPFAQIDLFYKAKGRIGCLKSAELRLRVREWCANDLIVTDYYADKESPDYYWLAGRDLFCPIYGGGRHPSAFIILTQFGFDIRDCLDSEVNVRREIRKHLEFWKGRAER